MKSVIAVAVLCIAGLDVAAAAAGTDRLVHRYLAVEISPDGRRGASVEGDSSQSGGAPTVRDLVIRGARAGAGVTVALPCGRAPQCWPESLTWQPDGKRLGFVLRAPGPHARPVD